MKLLKLLPFLFFIFCLNQTILGDNFEYTFKFQKDQCKSAKDIFIDNNIKYGNGNAYGLDFDSQTNNGKPFFFSADVAEGNYIVTIVIGSKEHACNTTVKSESRRLMLENISTQKGEFKKYTFVVNVRDIKISEGRNVKIKPREVGKLIWDDKLTLEFNGENPSIVSINIKKADNLLTIFIAGDSTVVDQADEPWTGWGQILTRFFNSKVAIANYAESGEAANTFTAHRRLEKLLTKMKKGDYLLIQFGHNDEKQKGKGYGPFLSYKKSLKVLIDKAREKGGIPVLITPMNRRTFDGNGKIYNSHGDYTVAMHQVAKEENVPLIDLNIMSKTLYEAWGEKNSVKAFVQYPAGTFPNQTEDLKDNTHFNPYGGYEIAKCVLQGMEDIKLPIRKYISKDFKGFDPAHPDAFDAVKIPQTPFFSVIKPDGN